MNKYLAMLRKHGPKSLLYFVSIGFKRIGIEWEDSYTYPDELQPQYDERINKEVECQEIRSVAQMSAEDIDGLTRYGFIPSLANIEDLFRRGQSCVLARLDGQFACAVWLIPCGPYSSHWFSTERFILLDRATTKPECRGKGILPAIFYFIVHNEVGYEQAGIRPKLLCKIWRFNYSSSTVATRVGFVRIRTTIKFFHWAWHKKIVRQPAQASTAIP